MSRDTMLPPSIRVALIGGGDHARHALTDAVHRLPGWSIVAVADPSAEARSRIAASVPNARLHADHHALLSDASDVDLIVIATPPAVSAAIVDSAWVTKAAILLEKPGAVLASELEGLRVVRGAPVSCAYGYRFHPTVMAFRAELAALGALERLELRFNAPIDAAGTWRAAREMGGGALRDLGAHLLDLASVLVPAPLLLEQCTTRSVRTDDDEVALSYRAGSARLDIRCAYHGAPEFSLQATGSGGELRADLWSMTTPARGRLAALASRVRTKLPGEFRPGEALRRSRVDMLSAAIAPSRTNPPASLEDAVRVIELIQAAEASAR